MRFLLVVVLAVFSPKCVVDGQTVATLPRLVSKFTLQRSLIWKTDLQLKLIFFWQIGEISASAPAFADIHESSDTSLPYADRFTLYVSTFKPFQITVLIDISLFQKYSWRIFSCFLNEPKDRSRSLLAFPWQIFVRYHQLANWDSSG